MERYTPNGVKQILNTLNKKEKEMHDAIIACHNRQKNEHPRYEAMTDEEFIQYKVDFIRNMNRKRKENRKEIGRFEAMI